MESDSEKTGSLRTELKEGLLEWEKHRGELERLLSTAEESLSPRSLFEHGPLIHCSSGQKALLIPFVHELWLVRSRISETIDMTRSLLSRVDKLSVGLNCIGDSPLTGEMLTSAVNKLESFADTLMEISKSIGKFPDKVVVV